jgi:hypothetical protein
MHCDCCFSSRQLWQRLIAARIKNRNVRFDLFALCFLSQQRAVMMTRVTLSSVFVFLLASLIGCQGTKTTVNNEQQQKISQILLTPTKQKKTPDGWEMIRDEKAGCVFTFPDGEWYQSPFVTDEWEGDSEIAILDEGGVYSVTLSPKEHLTSDEEFCAAVEAEIRSRDKEVLSTEVDAGEGVYCRAFASADCDEMLGEVICSTSLTRVYVANDKVYVLSVTLGFDELDDPAVENFFASFSLFDTEKQREAIGKFSSESATAMAKDIPIETQNGVMLILFESSRATLDDVEAALKDTAFQVKRDDQSSGREFLRATFPNGPTFRIYLNTAEAVKGRIQELAPQTVYQDGLARCDVQFEVVLEDLYETLDEINALIDLHATLGEFTGGYQLNCWNGNLSPAE